MSKIIALKRPRTMSVQPKIITNTPAGLSVMENKVMYQLLNQLAVDTDNDQVFHVLARNISRNTTKVKDALKKLEKRRYLIADEKCKYHSLPFIGELLYIEKKGIISIELHKKIIPYFLNIKSQNGYTSFNLKNAMSLSSVYSQKLYELLSSWRQTKQLRYDVAKLQKLMGAEKKSYGEFKRSCFLLALDEINKKTEFTVDYSEDRVGRTVVSLILCKVEKNKEANRELQTEINRELEIADTLSAADVKFHLDNMYRDYTFAPWQKDLLISNRSLFKLFVRLDLEIREGKRKITTTPTRYVAYILFIKKHKAA